MLDDLTWAPSQRDLKPSYKPGRTWLPTVMTLTCGVGAHALHLFGVRWLWGTAESNAVSRQRRRVAQPAAFPTVKFSWWKQTGFKADVHQRWSHTPTQEPISFCLFNKTIPPLLLMNMASFKRCIAQWTWIDLVSLAWRGENNKYAFWSLLSLGGFVM